MAEINGSALSEDSRIQINSMWLLTTQGPTCSQEVWARRARDSGVLDVGLGLRQSRSQRLDIAPLRGVVALAERARRCFFLGKGIGDQAAILGGGVKPVSLDA